LYLFFIDIDLNASENRKIDEDVREAISELMGIEVKGRPWTDFLKGFANKNAAVDFIINAAKNLPQRNEKTPNQPPATPPPVNQPPAAPAPIDIANDPSYG
jgi:hypothetical protein